MERRRARECNIRRSIMFGGSPVRSISISLIESASQPVAEAHPAPIELTVSTKKLMTNGHISYSRRIVASTSPDLDRIYGTDLRTHHVQVNSTALSVSYRFYVVYTSPMNPLHQPILSYIPFTRVSLFSKKFLSRIYCLL